MKINTALNKRKKKIRSKIKNQNKYRLTVYKSNKHIYTQLYNYDCNEVITSMSTLDKNFKKKMLNKPNITKIEKSKIIGEMLAEKIKNKNIYNVTFDRSGYKFHGRIKAIADSIKQYGIKC